MLHEVKLEQISPFSFYHFVSDRKLIASSHVVEGRIYRSARPGIYAWSVYVFHTNYHR